MVPKTYWKAILYEFRVNMISKNIYFLFKYTNSLDKILWVEAFTCIICRLARNIVHQPERKYSLFGKDWKMQMLSGLDHTQTL